jgi:hypothetical protein
MIVVAKVLFAVLGIVSMITGGSNSGPGGSPALPEVHSIEESSSPDDDSCPGGWGRHSNGMYYCLDILA